MVNFIEVPLLHFQYRKLPRIRKLGKNRKNEIDFWSF
jgi:hypothetical protein